MFIPIWRGDFQTAVHLWNEVGAPYDTAIARMGLATASRAEGSETLALLEFRTARSLFEQIGAKLEAARAAQEWLKELVELIGIEPATS